MSRTRPGWLVLVMALTLLLGACSTGGASTRPAPASNLASPSDAGSASSANPSPPSPSLTSPVAPTTTFDPSTLGRPAEAPDVTRSGTKTAAGVTTDDITFSRPDVAPTKAYLVHPAHHGKAAGPAVVWFHWLEYGDPTSNRTEFLDEARVLASKGVVSLLVQGTFPWTDFPSSLDHDVASVSADVRMLRAGLDLVAARDDVDPKRIALVGHDFGAMYSTVVFGSDDRPAALVVMAPTARWADWFLRYWPHPDVPETYTAAMAPLDPVTWLKAADGRPMLLQFAGQDKFVPADIAAQITGAAGDTGETRTYDTGHELDAAARTDRDTWLAHRLGFE